ncbi:MAG TPA: ribulose-phosphate 3-epimerase [Lachnospiraceae bacterium]|nr:ribulose-phosphate 3-epimerase [Lachnospiraceae bacterium]
MNYLSPSMLSIDFGNIEENIKRVVSAGTDYIHVDVMDGMFVPNISFGPPVIDYVKKAAGDTPLDVHLMIEKPERYVDVFKKSGADMLTIHYESTDDVAAVVKQIKEAGMEVGVALKPATPVEVLADVIDELDMVLIMSVEPGFGGQSFMDIAYEKLAETKKLVEERKLNCKIEVDGGITLGNLKKVLDAGANVIVAGSAIFKNDIEKNIADFKEIMDADE